MSLLPLLLLLLLFHLLLSTARAYRGLRCCQPDDGQPNCKPLPVVDPADIGAKAKPKKDKKDKKDKKGKSEWEKQSKELRKAMKTARKTSPRPTDDDTTSASTSATSGVSVEEMPVGGSASSRPGTRAGVNDGKCTRATGCVCATCSVANVLLTAPGTLGVGGCSGVWHSSSCNRVRVAVDRGWESHTCVVVRCCALLCVVVRCFCVVVDDGDFGVHLQHSLRKLSRQR